MPARPPQHALPRETDAFFGRAGELERLAGLLEQPGLVTILGGAGTGKTRLARRAAWTLLGRFPGGAWFCDLSEARSAEELAVAAARGLDLHLGKDDPVAQVGHALAARGDCLVVLDNLEHLVPYAERTLGEWLRRAGRARLLATSRALLRLPGERAAPLEPLPAESDGAALLVARLAKALPGFVMTPARRPAVISIARTLEGVLLAIELAAARGIEPEALDAQLRERFSSLAADGPSALEGAIAWSWDLLEGWEQSALAQLSAFAGGFSLESAEAVLDLEDFEDPPWPEDAIQSLLDKSMLRTWSVTGLGERADIEEPFFGMFVSIHEFVAEKLRTEGAFPGSGPGARAGAWARHGQIFARRGARAALDALELRGGLRLRRALALELDNLVIATRRAAARGDAATASACCLAACAVYRARGPFAAGVQLIRTSLGADGLAPRERAALQLAEGELRQQAGLVDEAAAALAAARATLAPLGDPRLRADADRVEIAVRLSQGRYDEVGELVGEALGRLQGGSDPLNEGGLRLLDGVRRFRRGESAEAEACYRSALSIAAGAGARTLEIRGLINLGFLQTDRGQIDAAEATLDRALVILRDAESPALHITALVHRGRAVRMRGRPREALPYARESLALARRLGDRANEAIALANLGHLHDDLGELEEALGYLDRALAIHRELGNRHQIGVIAGSRGSALLALGRADEAEVDFQEALDIARSQGERWAIGVQLGNLGRLETLRGRLEAARGCYREALEHHRAIGAVRYVAVCAGSLADLAIQFGEPEDASAALEVNRAALEGVGDRRLESYALVSRGHLARREGRDEQALALLEQALALALETGNAAMEISLRGALGRLAAEQGRPDRGPMEAALSSEAAGAWRGERARLLGDLGVVAALEGRPGEARARLAEAEAELRAIGDVPELAVLLCDRAEVERRLGDMGEAARALAAARGLAQGLAMPPATALSSTSTCASAAAFQRQSAASMNIISRSCCGPRMPASPPPAPAGPPGCSAPAWSPAAESLYSTPSFFISRRSW